MGTGGDELDPLDFIDPFIEQLPKLAQQEMIQQNYREGFKRRWLAVGNTYEEMIEGGVDWDQIKMDNNRRSARLRAFIESYNTEGREVKDLSEMGESITVLFSDPNRGETYFLGPCT